MLYAVEITIATTGKSEISRLFQTIRAAKRWAKWVQSQQFIASARIMACRSAQTDWIIANAARVNVPRLDCEAIRAKAAKQ